MLSNIRKLIRKSGPLCIISGSEPNNLFLNECLVSALTHSFQIEPDVDRKRQPNGYFLLVPNVNSATSHRSPWSPMVLPIDLLEGDNTEPT